MSQQYRKILKNRLQNEIGARVKDWGGKVPVGLVYPNVYYLGMSGLGYQTLYGLLNADPGLVCERVFLPDTEFGVSRSTVLSVESQRPLGDFPLIAASVTYELDYINMIALLRGAGISVLRDERTEGDPIVLAGGPAPTLNPEPLSVICDAVAIGEAEPMMPALREWIKGLPDMSRADALQALSHIPGIYVPSVHDRQGQRSGGTEEPSGWLVAPRVQRQWARDLDAFSTRSEVLTHETEFGDAYMIEVARGCGRQCRFCVAGFAFLPERERSLDHLLALAREGLRHRRKIALISAMVSDYSHIDQLALELRAMGASFSCASLRADSLSETLVKCLADGGARSLTVAPEAGSQRLRDVINKGISEDDVLRAVTLATRHGMQAIKLYYMIGLPTETEADVAAIVDLTERTMQAAERVCHRRIQVVCSVTPFVPKPQTPFQWAGMERVEVLEARAKYLRSQLGRRGISFRVESPRLCRLETILSRGGREVGLVLAQLEEPTAGALEKALERSELDLEALTAELEWMRQWPWHKVDAGLRERYFQREWVRARREQTTRECPPAGVVCHRCGVCEPGYVRLSGGLRLPVAMQAMQAVRSNV
jgi:radical SAM superfamily enzyme YgiQ (UPF0313 family)